MGYARDGCKINSGDIIFDGIDLLKASESEKRKIRGNKISYVAQSAAAAFNPAHRLLDQFTEAPVDHGIMSKVDSREKGRSIYKTLDLPEPEHIGERWPHQVSGGNVQGSAFLSEGLSEYSAVSLLAKEKGEKQLRKFLKYELDRYLMGRAMESKFEPTIVQTEGQQYIHYNKAGLVMYTLSDFIGRSRFNKAKSTKYF